jgi:hypothetical protein
MKALTRFGYGLVLALGLALLLLASGCALERDVPLATAGPIDSLVRVTPGLSTGKVKFNGPVTFQIGGTGNTATSTDIAKAKAPVAAAPHATATATETTSKTGPPLVVYVLLGVGSLLAGAVGGFLLARRLPAWLPL